MKKTAKLFALVMACSMLLLALVSCSSFGTVKGRFEDAGYTLVEGEGDGDAADNMQILKAALAEEGVTYTVHLFKKASADLPYLSFYAAIVEFNSSEELNQTLADNNTLRGLLQDIEEADLDYVEGNCLLVPLSVLKHDEMVKIFKNRS